MKKPHDDHIKRPMNAFMVKYIMLELNSYFWMEFF